MDEIIKSYLQSAREHIRDAIEALDCCEDAAFDDVAKQLETIDDRLRNARVRVEVTL